MISRSVYTFYSLSRSYRIGPDPSTPIYLFIE